MHKITVTKGVPSIYVIVTWAAKLKIQRFAATIEEKFPKYNAKITVFKSTKPQSKASTFSSLKDQNFLNVFQKKKQYLRQNRILHELFFHKLA